MLIGDAAVDKVMMFTATDRGKEYEHDEGACRKALTDAMKNASSKEE